MSWIALTAADVQRQLSGAELTALKTAAKASSQDGDTILSEAITDVTRKVRGYVAACQRNVLGDGTTIPDELKASAIALVRDFLFTRLPGLKDLYDDARKDATKNAMAELRDVAACKFLIVQPETAAANQAGGPAVELVESRARNATRERTKGFL